jgi:cytochrome c553
MSASPGKGRAREKPAWIVRLLAIAQAAQAADIDVGKQLATTVCAACQGANGVSVSDGIPNLAAQRAGYIEARLKAFKDGTRQAAGAVGPTPSMAAMAPQLNAEDIANVAAYFASQPGAASGAKPALLPNIAKTRVTFPEGYKEAFTKYHTINFPSTRQVRYFYANTVAVAAARAGKPLPDGFGPLRGSVCGETRHRQQAGRRPRRLLRGGQAACLHGDGERRGLGRRPPRHASKRRLELRGFHR